SALKNKLYISEEENSNLTKKCNQYELTIKANRNKINLVEHHIEKINSELESYKYNNKNNQILLEKINILTNDNSILTKKLDHINSINTGYNNKIKFLEHHIDVLKSNIQFISTEFSSTTAKLTNTIKDNEKLNDILRAANKKINELNTENGYNIDKISKLQKNLDEDKDNLEKLALENENLRQLISDNAKNSINIEFLQNENINLGKIIANLNETINNHVANIEELEKKYNMINNENIALKQQKEKNNKMEIEIKNLIQTNINNNRIMSKQKKELDYYKNLAAKPQSLFEIDNNDYEEKINSLLEREKQLTEEKNSYLSEIESLKAQNKLIEENCKNIQQENTNLKLQIKTLEEQNNTKKENDNKENQGNEIEQEIANKLEGLLSKLSKKI
ncbi:MAG: hypothetical protein IJK61_04005, partial [Bacteroidetes bacterium]|nr:hypothetical protein [Bacteroidota bacterium]